jgi:hypothetical protein
VFFFFFFHYIVARKVIKMWGEKKDYIAHKVELVGRFVIIS